MYCCFISITLCMHKTKVAQCGSLANIEDGQVMTPSTQEGGVATYTCSAGYRIEQVENTRTCQVDGMWSGSEPTCRECKYL